MDNWEPGIKGCSWASVLILALTWATSVMLRVGGCDCSIAPRGKTQSCSFTKALHVIAEFLWDGSSSSKLCKQTQQNLLNSLAHVWFDHCPSHFCIVQCQVLWGRIEQWRLFSYNWSRERYRIHFGHQWQI